MKSYAKPAYMLVIAGMSIFMFERFGLQTLSSNGNPVHLNGTLLTILVIAPVVLVIGGCMVFMVGAMRRRKPVPPVTPPRTVTRDPDQA